MPSRASSLPNASPKPSVSLRRPSSMSACAERFLISPIAFVVWRYSHVWSGIAGMGLGKARVLALARLQQRRIGAALQ